MSTVSDEIANFDLALSATPDVWQSIEVRIVAVLRHGEWHNLISLARLDSRNPPVLDATEILAKTPSLLAVRSTIPFADLSSLIDGVIAGEFIIAGYSIRFMVESHSTLPAPYNHAAASICSVLNDQPLGAPLMWGHELMISGDSTAAVMADIRGGYDQLSQELRSAAEPWDGLEALLEYGLGAPRRLDNNSAQFFVRAPLSIRLRPDVQHLRNGQIDFTVETSNTALSAHCSVGYVATLQGILGARGTIKPSRKSDWAAREGISAWTGAKEVFAADQVALFVRVGPYLVDRAIVVDERLRVQRPLVNAYRELDDEFEILTQRLLAPKRSEQGDFERAVARVFLFCGFAVDSFAGDNRLSDAVDAIAHAVDQKTVLVIECTTGPLQSRDGKLSRLVMRSRLIEAAFSPEGRSPAEVSVRSVIATPLHRSDVSSSDRNSANADGIIVLDNEGLSELLAIARSGAGPSAALRLLRKQPALESDEAQLF